jgi:SAM-dependent methyltransferase
VADEELREASRTQWSIAAAAWARDAERRESGPFRVAADWMLEAARVGAGASVLEVACGAGDVGLRAAALVGTSGRVVCSDFAEPMVEVVSERARAAGLDHVEARVLDAEDPDLGGERFDAVLCRFGYMLMPNPGRALSAGHGALRDGGRIALAVWGPAEDNPWLSLVTSAVMKTLGAPPPAPGTPSPFALADHERLRALLAAAGFAEITVESARDSRPYESVDAWWDGMREPTGPMGALLSQLSGEQVTAIGDDATSSARRDGHVAADGSVRFPAHVVLASATRGGTPAG